MNLKLFVEKTKKNSSLNYFSYNMLASFIIQIRSFIFIWIAAQRLSVEEYGVFALVLMLIMTAADLSDMGVNSAVTRFSSQYYAQAEYKKELSIVYLALKRKVTNALIVIALLNTFSNQIARLLLGSEKYYLLVCLSSLGVFFALLNGLSVAIMQGRKLFRDYLKIVSIISVIALCIVLIWTFFREITIEFLIIYYIAIFAGSFVLSIFYLGFSTISFKDLKIIDQEIKYQFNAFGFWMFLWALFAVLQSKIDMFMLSQLATVEQVAYYDIAMKFTKPLLMVFAAYGQVLNPIMASITNKNELVKQINKTIKFVLLMSAGLLILTVCANMLVTFAFGNRYMLSVIPLQIILIALVFFVWTMPYNSALFALNKPHVFTFAAMAGLLVTVVGNYLLLPMYGAIGASVTFMLSQIMGLAVSIVFYKRYYNQYLAIENEDLLR